MAKTAPLPPPKPSETAVPKTEKREATVVVVVTEQHQGGKTIKTISRVRQFPESLITALPEGIRQPK